MVTGAAGSIVSAITSDLASASGGTFYLLDLVPEPDPANPDLTRFVSDKEGLKRDLFARIQARGERATPALVEKELVVLERAHAALSAINAVRAAGGTAHYFSVNLTDADAVAGVIGQVRQRSGRIDVLLHAAGIERSHFLPDKDPREFDLIFDVKSDGWFNLLRAIGDMPLAATVAFSSIAGRFGNGGQADYSSANDLLCKITSSFRTTRPTTRGIAIDWTAWGGIGMATRGSIPKMMELAGIDMLPPEAGIPLIRRELTSGGTRGEILIGQRLGLLLHEWDATGGLDLNAAAAVVEALSPAPGPMIGKVASMAIHSGLTIETTLDPALQPFLHDHQIGGTPVLPGVMGIEAFVEAALVMLPGYHVEVVEDISFLAPFKFYRNQPRTVAVQTIISQQGSAVVADCRLIGRRTLPNRTEPGSHNSLHGSRALNPAGARGSCCSCNSQRQKVPSCRLLIFIAFTSTAPPTKFWAKRGWMKIASWAGWLTTCPCTTTRRTALCFWRLGSLSFASKLPGYGKSVRKAAWGFRSLSIRSACGEHRNLPVVRCMPWSLPIRSREASMRKWWTRQGTGTCRLPVTKQSHFQSVSMVSD